MDCILIGNGQIGHAVFEVFLSNQQRVDIVDKKWVLDDPVIKEAMGFKNSYDIMLVTIPYSDDFVQIVKDYQKQFNPKATIIFSTVAIGTTRQIPNAVHSPVEGRHPDLAESIRKMQRFIGGISQIPLYNWNVIVDFFRPAIRSIPMYYQIVDNSEHTEALKLMSTSLYGLNIEFARYRKEVADAIGMDYELVKAFDKAYNELYKELGLEQFQRYILDPPEGNLGGHCVTSNSKILNKQFPSIFLEEINRDKEE